MALTPEQAAHFAENGYVVVQDVISPETLRDLRARVEDICGDIAKAQAEAKARHSSGDREGVTFLSEGGGTATATKPALRKLAALAPSDPFFREIAASAKILDVVAELTGGAKTIMLYSDQVFLKPAHCGSAKPLHQDNSNFKITPASTGITCWMAIDDATLENGCLRYVPGSHKLGLVPHKSIKNTPHLIPESDEFYQKEVPCPVPAGSAVFHHTLALHDSVANTSPHARRAWALHYANRAAESCVKPWAEMLQVR